MNSQSQKPGVVGSRGIARMLGVPHDWVLDQIRSGELPGVMAGEKRALGVPSEIEKAIAEKCRYNPRGETNNKRGPERQ